MHLTPVTELMSTTGPFLNLVFSNAHQVEACCHHLTHVAVEIITTTAISISQPYDLLRRKLKEENLRPTSDIIEHILTSI
jgi:hypothetical protein